MNQDEISKANSFLDRGSIEELYEFIKPMIATGDPYALYIYSGFSLADWNESDEEYDARYIDCLTKASEGNVAGAMYRLSTLYAVGDMVPLDTEKAKLLLEGSLHRGYSPAKLTLGLYLYHGSNGYEKDLNRAKELIRQAAVENVEGAEDALQLFGI